jgi:hypothetical protein
MEELVCVMAVLLLFVSDGKGSSPECQLLTQPEKFEKTPDQVGNDGGSGR